MPNCREVRGNWLSRDCVGAAAGSDVLKRAKDQTNLLEKMDRERKGSVIKGREDALTSGGHEGLGLCVESVIIK